jgi:hypothetical protein
LERWETRSSDHGSSGRRKRTYGYLTPKGEIEMKYLREALTTVVLAGLTLGTVRIANATTMDTDTIIDSNSTQGIMTTLPDDPTYVFTCCGGSALPITNLEVLYAANVTPFLVVSPAAGGCVASAFANTSIQDICSAINVGDTITETTPAGATFVSGCWTIQGGICAATASPTIPESSSISLLLIGLLGFFGYGWHWNRGRPSRGPQ